MTTTMHPSDPLHVLLDAVKTLRDRINSDPSFKPWDDYYGDGWEDGDAPERGAFDPKANQPTYMDVIDAAERALQSKMGAGVPL